MNDCRHTPCTTAALPLTMSMGTSITSNAYHNALVREGGRQNEVWHVAQPENQGVVTATAATLREDYQRTMDRHC